MSSSIRIQVSAPGKVILFGEHSVVYNKTAVAASLDLRTTGTLDINISNQSTTNGNISFTFADIQLEKQFSIQSFQNFLSQSPDLSDDGWEKNLQYIDNTILNSDTSFCNNVQRLSCRAFILLFWHILSEHKKAILPFHFVIKSQLSIGAGMGSSASFAVVLAASLLQYRKFIQTGKQDFKISDVELNLIQDYSMLSERLAHEKPSGIDNAICTFGGVIAFQKQPPRCERITLVNKRTPLDVIFVNSAVSRETSKLVGKVRDLQTRLPHVMQSLMETFDQIALEAINQLKSKQGYDRAKLEDLIRMNHGLLRGIDVSHPKLEEIVSIAEKYRCACKLTGAGGGGFAYILSPTDVIQMNKLTQDLKSSHFQYNILNLGGQGVKDDTTEIIL